MFDASKQGYRLGVCVMECDMNASLARLRGLIAVDVGYLGLLLLLESGFPIFPVLMLQGSVQDRNNGDHDRHDEEWNQPVKDSHWDTGFCARHLLSHGCALPDNLSTEPGAILGGTWLNPVSIALCVHIVYVPFPALRLLHVRAVGFMVF